MTHLGTSFRLKPLLDLTALLAGEVQLIIATLVSACGTFEAASSGRLHLRVPSAYPPHPIWRRWLSPALRDMRWIRELFTHGLHNAFASCRDDPDRVRLSTSVPTPHLPVPVFVVDSNRFWFYKQHGCPLAHREWWA